jgi:signal transduction histidine kinase
MRLVQQAAAKLMVALALALPAWSIADERPILFLGDRDLAPYEFLVNGVPRGANVDLAQAIGRVLGRTVEVQLVEWGEAQRRVRAGEADALTMLGRTPERDVLYEFSRPTLPFAVALFIRTSDEDEFVGGSPKRAFRGKRIGVTRAGIARPLLGDMIPEAELVDVDNLFDGTRRLVNHDIDAVAGQMWSQSFLIQELGLRGLMSLPPFVERRSSMAVRKGNTELLAQIDQALEQIEASGELNAIVERWSTTKLRLVSEQTLVALTAAVAVTAATLILLAVGLGWSRRQKRALEREIEERRRAEQALRESQVALEQVDQSKDRFIATLAHELRNPLAPISNAVLLLEAQGGDLPQARWAREVIGRQTRHLARLIDDLLDVGRINSGKLELRLAPVTLLALIEEAIEGSRPAIERGCHRLRVTMPQQPVWLNADRTRLVQAVMNLLTNAAKYTTQSDEIELEAAVDGDRVTIAVRDRGVGIPAGEVDHVFDMFHQEQRVQAHSQGGLGIGLWLTRRLVEMHGGTVEARSKGTDCGAEFVISLIRMVDNAPQASEAPFSRSTSPSSAPPDPDALQARGA